ncbi:hypothetical protein C2857_006558 [Epichloe festucae Fl1]|uniref:Transcription elongation factor Eaf N-terminal domain-containing protein n=1 Tax=Epichloe festucae (strain Fl1) TaxID=877507 RepID=A0A7S9KLT4_EPIFF|nr:hypothetical protein C2857_006558 [Epichloe festucae Fl1]
MAGLIDPTLEGKYPVILGDGLLGRTSDGIFTGIRYNHKPTLSSNDAPNNARLKPSLPGKTDSYDLTFTDDDGNYAYSGSRNTNSNQYVLHFDPERKAFILDKIDSTFNMNMTRLPSNSDPERLRSQYPHLDSQSAPKKVTTKKTTGTKETHKSTTSKSQSQAKEPKRKVEKKQQQQQQQQQQQAKQVALSFPEPQKEKPKPKAKSFEDEEEDDEDDDGGLLIEYPGGDAAKQADFSPAFPPPRRFDDFMDRRESEADDADGESDDEPDMDFKLPSPVNHHTSHPTEPMNQDNVAEVQDDEGDGMNPMDDDLEKDMEMAFEDMANTPDSDESEISEED